MTHIVRDLLPQIFLHEENLADLLTRTLHHSQHQRVVAALQLHTLCSINTAIRLLIERYYLYAHTHTVPCGLTSARMDQVDGEIVRTVFNLELVEEDA